MATKTKRPTIAALNKRLREAHRLMNLAHRQLGRDFFDGIEPSRMNVLFEEVRIARAFYVDTLKDLEDRRLELAVRRYPKVAERAEV